MAEIELDAVYSIAIWYIQVLAAVLCNIVIGSRVIIGPAPCYLPVVVQGELEPVGEVSGQLPASLGRVVGHVLCGISLIPSIVDTYASDAFYLCKVIGSFLEVNVYLVEACTWVWAIGAANI